MKKNYQLNSIAWLGLLFILLVCITSCKKKESKPEEQVVTQPIKAKGAMEGEYIWFAGDSIVSNLVLTTDYIDIYNPTVMYNCDRYSLNQYISNSYGESRDMMIFRSGYNKDTITTSSNNRWFKFYKKK